MAGKKGDAVVECIRTRRSVRTFSGKAVSDETVRHLIEAAQWAPSACNKQAWEFIIVRKDRTKKELVRMAGAVRFMQKSPVVIYVLYRKDVTREYGANIQSAAAAVQNMLLAAHSLGLGSVWVCHCGREKVLRGMLNIPGNLGVVCAVCLGYPGEVPTPPRRGEVSTVIHEERYGGGAPPLSIHPADWSLEQLLAYRENGIRAQSPTPESFRPDFPEEMKKEAAVIAGAIKGSKSVLDVMPFSGNSLLEVIREAGLKSVHVCETSAQIADFIERRRQSSGPGCRIEIRIQRGLNLPYENDTFDAVTCIRKLEMLPDPRVLVSEISRVTKPGGKVVISFWNARSVYGLNYIIKTGLFGRIGVTSNEGPVKPLSKAAVTKLLSQNGLRVVLFHGVNLLPAGMKSYATKGPLNGICRVIVAEAVKDPSMA